MCSAAAKADGADGEPRPGRRAGQLRVPADEVPPADQEHEYRFRHVRHSDLHGSPAQAGENIPIIQRGRQLVNGGTKYLLYRSFVILCCFYVF